MPKRRKVRYTSKGNPFPTFTTTGRVYLKHEEDKAIAAAEKGDIYLYMHLERADRGEIEPDYYAIGDAGYLKAMVHDGRGWKPLLTDIFFPQREHRFGKRERPIDTCDVCRELLETHQGTVLERTYREHYRPLEEEVKEE